MPRSEIKVSNKLHELNFDFFLPLVKRIKEYKNQKRKVVQPLFPGYIFIKVTPGFRHHITAIKGVLFFVRFSNEYAKIRDDEILSIKAMIENVKDHTKIVVADLNKFGKILEIQHGPLKGFKGKVIGKNGNSKLKLELAGLNKMIIVNIDDIKIAEYSIS